MALSQSPQLYGYINPSPAILAYLSSVLFDPAANFYSDITDPTLLANSNFSTLLIFWVVCSDYR